MSSRQNKKRKGRNNGLNRERTVTTLTEGPESSFLVPTSTEELAGNIMSSPTFSVASSGAGGPTMSPANFQMAAAPFSAFSYNNYIPSMSAPSFTPQHPSQQFFHSPPSQDPLPTQASPPGQGDLELLEKLKESIKNNQHAVFRAVPQPAALLNVYLGPKSFSQVSSHVEQAFSDQHHAQQPSDPKDRKSPPSPANEYTQRSRPQSSQVQEVSGKMNAESSVSKSPTVNNNTYEQSSDAPSNGHRYDDSQRYNSRSGGVSASRPTKLSDLKASSSVSLSSVDTVHNYEPMETANARQTSSFDSDGHPHPMKPDPDAAEVNRGPDDFPSSSANAFNSFDSKDDPRSVRDNGWKYRNGPDDGAPRMRHRPPFNGRPDTRFGNGPENGTRFAPRAYDRDRDRDRDRERDHDHDKDRDWDRERDRDRRGGGDFNKSRFRDRSDDRTRAEREWHIRPHEPSYLPHRYDPKSSNDPATASKTGQADERTAPDPTSAPRSAGEDRSFPRRPLESHTTRLHNEPRPGAPPLLDDRPPRPPPSAVDDRRGPMSPVASDRQPRPDDRRPFGRPLSPALSDRQNRAGEEHPVSPPLAPAAMDRTARTGEDVDHRRPPPPPLAAQPAMGTDVAMRYADKHRHSPPLPGANERQSRFEDRRPLPPPAPPTAPDRQVRQIDDHRQPAPPAGGDRQMRPPTVDDRRPPLPPTSVNANAERQVRPTGNGDDRRAPVPSSVPDDRDGPRLPPASDASRMQRPPTQEEKVSRPPAPLEDRISRHAPTLQDRLSTASSASSNKPEDRPSQLAQSSRAGTHLGRIGHGSGPPNEYNTEPAPSLEARLSHPPASDPRSAPSDDRGTRPPTAGALPPVTDRSARPADEHAALPAAADSVRPSVPSGGRPLRPDDRGRPPDRFGPPGDRRPPPPAAPPLHGGPPPRASSVAREEPRAPWKAQSPPRFYSPSRSPTRPAARDFASSTATDVRRDRPESRPPFRLDQDRYPERRPDMMDVDPASSRYSGAPRHTSPAPEPYYMRGTDARWPREYPEDPVRRVPPDPQYRRGWTENERAYEDWPAKRHAWEPPRDGLLVDHEPVASNGWETREERERRVAVPTDPSPSSGARPFEPRPSGPRVPESYSGEERGYGRELDRPRYPPMDVPPAPYSRVRPRSPSPAGRRIPGTDEDLRPPIKRPREDAYPYYPPATGDPPRAPPALNDYPPPRMRTPPPPTGGAYYDDPRPAPYPVSPVAPGQPRDRQQYGEPPLRNDVSGYHRYDRRPPPRSPPPPFGRGYTREDRRYSMPPPQ